MVVKTAENGAVTVVSVCYRAMGGGYSRLQRARAEVAVALHSDPVLPTIP